MKKLITILVLTCISVTTYAQSIFDKFEDMDNVTSLVVNKNMFKMLAKIDFESNDKESQEFFDMVEKLSSLKILTTEDENISENMGAEVKRYLKKSSLEELMSIKDGNELVKFYVRYGDNETIVKELLMFATGLKEKTKDANINVNGKKRVFETVLLTLTGEIDLKQLAKLSKMMDIPGGEQLEKAGK